MVQNQGFRSGALLRGNFAAWGQNGGSLFFGRANRLPRFRKLPAILPREIIARLQRLRSAIGAQGHFLYILMNNIKIREKREKRESIGGIRARETAPIAEASL